MEGDELERAYVGLNEMTDEDIEEHTAAQARQDDDLTLVYCTRCLKTHAVTRYEEPCVGGQWLDPDPIR